MHTRLLLLVLCLGLLPLTVTAQDVLSADPLPTPTQVSIAAVDELVLAADWYLIDGDQPTVLLIHQLYTDRRSWDEVVLHLHESGFNVLSVDVRGAGATGGAINWRAAIDDIGSWLTWLHDVAGVRPDGINVLGSSMGSSLAIEACAQTTLCRAVVAISPGWDYYSITLDESIATRPVLAIYAERDRWPALGVPQMQEAAPESLHAVVLPGNAHGMNLLHAQFDVLMPQIMTWLAVHSG